ncbi:class I SAM-dependent methyltransferase [Agrilutibacter solisilvae]|uniref:Methyltransferase domain-containing protein n=1 Tax=Agrilutibacter solisilvae TaxID=2763317 RepID=A0A975ARP0_9GAMM|nr:methyltransferase domain-containing protein [Lysobacter solisilvae]QSX77857.1 methyltransferase domain-containing protein [Lysobacter solisilvae]
MPGYATRNLTVQVGGHDYRLRMLSDKQQYADRDGLAHRAGISSAQWCLFGQHWPAGQVLAQAMSEIELGGRRILELGCGLGLSSLVLKHRGADITASDHHPLANEFLQHNAILNGLSPICYRDLPWTAPDATLGRFDLIIGSDILYERDHGVQLAAVMLRHAHPDALVMIADPGRGQRGGFTRSMLEQGYLCCERSPDFGEHRGASRGRLLSYRRPSKLN